jgi:CRISPR-associated endonuclease/helicase Cas3
MCSSARAAIIGAHHDRIKGRRLGSIHIGFTGGSLWDEARRRLIDELTICFGPLPISPCASDSILWSVAGLATVADWIGSDERFFLPDGSRNEDAPAGARKAIDSIGWRAPRFQSGRGFADWLAGRRRPLQEAALSLLREPGLYVIEAQMGSGKTEAALVGVYQLIADKHAAGLFFALPTQVTSNRAKERVAAFLAQADAKPDSRRLRLAHSTSWLREEQHPPSLHPAIRTDVEPSDHASSGRSWFGSSKRALLASYGVGTIDQAFSGSLRQSIFSFASFRCPRSVRRPANR